MPRASPFNISHGDFWRFLEKYCSYCKWIRWPFARGEEPPWSPPSAAYQGNEDHLQVSLPWKALIEQNDGRHLMISLKSWRQILITLHLPAFIISIEFACDFTKKVHNGLEKLFCYAIRSSYLQPLKQKWLCFPLCTCIMVNYCWSCGAAVSICTHDIVAVLLVLMLVWLLISQFFFSLPPLSSHSIRPCSVVWTKSILLFIAWVIVWVT